MLPPRIEAALPFSRKLVGVDLEGGARIDLHVVEHGDRRGRPVLFLHGNRSWAVTWRQVMQRCAADPISATRTSEGYRLVAIDLPGFGLSGDLAPRKRTLDGYGESVARLTDTLSIDDPLVVVHDSALAIAAAAERRLLAAADRAADRAVRAADREVDRATDHTRNAVAGADTPSPGRFGFAGAVVVSSSPFANELNSPRRPATLHRFGALPRWRDAVFVATGRPRLALDALQSQRASFAATAADLYAWPLRRASRRRALVDLAALAADRCVLRATAEWIVDFPGPLALVWGHRDPLLSARDFAALERELPYARIWRTEAGHFVQEEEPDAIVQAIEWTAQRAGSVADPDGIPANFLPGIGSGDYLEVGRTQARRLIDYAGLAPSDRILDLGCGLGRTAQALRDYLSPDARYDGVDVVRDVVRWCQQNLSRVDRRLRFHHAPVRSGIYSPDSGIDARDYRFPWSDASFDFVVAESLFTHLTAEEARHYLIEIGRVLRPGGTLCFSLFLLDTEARRAIEEGKSDHRFPVARGDEWIEDPEQPLLAVALAPEWLASALGAAGLEPLRPVAPGAWRGVENAISYQDTLIARRRP
jgi:pimeloyl-ACP methyl ester carboxylesterase/SAM-dependent methyltransferase